jgi:hypothetical protein
MEISFSHLPVTGLPADHEVHFLRLMETVTNGCVVQINHTGTPRAPHTHDASFDASF